MKYWTSKTDTSSQQYLDNEEKYSELIEQLRQRQEIAISGGSGRAKSIQRHLDRNKVLARDRI